jgi:hypothetical protein
MQREMKAASVLDSTHPLLMEDGYADSASFICRFGLRGEWSFCVGAGWTGGS